jgi:GNAT superfamily N-acetyltransferase
METRFLPLDTGTPGLVVELLAECYEPLLAQLPPLKGEQLLAEWRAYDDAVQSEPDSVGASGFFTVFCDQVIGFGSWDPREWPDRGRVGHNCIRPAYQGHGHGCRQIEEILARFQRGGFRAACVRTDEHVFFAPARRMYARCGFYLAGREPGTLLDDHATLVHEKMLDGGAG